MRRRPRHRALSGPRSAGSEPAPASCVPGEGPLSPTPVGPLPAPADAQHRCSTATSSFAPHRPGERHRRRKGLSARFLSHPPGRGDAGSRLWALRPGSRGQGNAWRPPCGRRGRLHPGEGPGPRSSRGRRALWRAPAPRSKLLQSLAWHAWAEATEWATADPSAVRRRRRRRPPMRCRTSEAPSPSAWPAYSARITDAGSRRMAEAAGSRLANAPTRRRRAAVAVTTPGSVRWIP